MGSSMILEGNLFTPKAALQNDKNRKNANTSFSLAHLSCLCDLSNVLHGLSKPDNSWKYTSYDGHVRGAVWPMSLPETLKVGSHNPNDILHHHYRFFYCPTRGAPVGLPATRTTSTDRAQSVCTHSTR
ncbi:hypothetical protein Pst134EB_018210 [Puccinia striiformis f. sp. tritici]|nr:hypothetical protein Pst134EB_018210 [Puccinia striiformis f. sp. tritici]